MTVTVLQITDTHIHDQQDVSFKNTRPDFSLQKIIQHVKKNLSNIDYLVVTGDLTHDGTDAACIRLRNLLKQFACPVYVTLGNHDSTDIIQRHLLDVHISMPDKIETNYWQLLFADSHIENQPAGLITDHSLEKLSQQLQQCDKPALLFTHHPPVNINCAWLDKIGMKNGEQVLQQLSIYKNLHALAFGHIHQIWHSQYQHIDILGTPSSCVQFKADSDEFALEDDLPGYRVFHLHDNGEFDSEVIRLRNEHNEP